MWMVNLELQEVELMGNLALGKSFLEDLRRATPLLARSHPML
jgi:hypothetical protein